MIVETIFRLAFPLTTIQLSFADFLTHFLIFFCQTLILLSFFLKILNRMLFRKRNFSMLKIKISASRGLQFIFIIAFQQQQNKKTTQIPSSLSKQQPTKQLKLYCNLFRLKRIAFNDNIHLNFYSYLTLPQFIHKWKSQWN